MPSLDERENSSKDSVVSKALDPCNSKLCGYNISDASNMHIQEMHS